MYTISIKEAQERLTKIMSNRKNKELINLINLVYESGKHDGWYERANLESYKEKLSSK